MKKLIVRGSLFLTCSIAVYLFVFACLFFIKDNGIPLIYRCSRGNVWKGGGTYIKFRDFNEKEKWDIIILGSSHAYRGYDPQIFSAAGYKTYNLGTSAQNMMCSYQVARTHLNNQNCKTVILDLYDRVFTMTGIEPVSDLIANASSDLLAIRVTLSAKDPRGANMFTLRMFNKNSIPLDVDTTGYINGYLPSAVSFKKNSSFKENVYTTANEQLQYLDKLIQYLQSQNIKVILTEHPLPDAYSPVNHHTFAKDINLIAEKYNVPFLDFTFKKELQGIEFFKDENHLNASGVQMYNRLLISELLNMQLLPLPSLHKNDIFTKQ